MNPAEYTSVFPSSGTLPTVMPPVRQAGEAARYRVLFISYAFPPTGGAGVQRSAKFVKYLPQFGWQPTVLTVANPSVPTHDHDLISDVPDSVQVVRAPTREPGYTVKQKVAAGPGGARWLRRLTRRLAMQLLQPDPQILWNRNALRAADRRLREQPHHAIYVSGPPFSSFLLASQLKRRFALPLVLDFRDEWLLATRYQENHCRSGRAFRRQEKMMQRVLEEADAVIATTDRSALTLAQQVADRDAQATTYRIYNGYDFDDLRGLEPEVRSNGLFRIVYAGTLWKLTDIGPLVNACRHLQSLAGERTKRLEIVLLGRVAAEQRGEVDRLKETGVDLVERGYVDHRRALSVAASADLLLLLLADVAEADRVVPAKCFEYMALQRPILAICPGGELERLVRHCPNAFVFQPHESSAIADLLDGLARRGPSPAWQCPEEDLNDGFHRRNLAAGLANVLTRSLFVRQARTEAAALGKFA